MAGPLRAALAPIPLPPPKAVLHLSSDGFGIAERRLGRLEDLVA
jgi:hypothetical protein